jgi:hypothetical protein
VLRSDERQLQQGRLGARLRQQLKKMRRAMSRFSCALQSQESEQSRGVEENSKLLGGGKRAMNVDVDPDAVAVRLLEDISNCIDPEARKAAVEEFCAQVAACSNCDARKKLVRTCCKFLDIHRGHKGLADWLEVEQLQLQRSASVAALSLLRQIVQSVDPALKARLVKKVVLQIQACASFVSRAAMVKTCCKELKIDNSQQEFARWLHVDVCEFRKSQSSTEKCIVVCEVIEELGKCCSFVECGRVVRKYCRRSRIDVNQSSLADRHGIASDDFQHRIRAAQPAADKLLAAATAIAKAQLLDLDGSRHLNCCMHGCRFGVPSVNAKASVGRRGFSVDRRNSKATVVLKQLRWRPPSRSRSCAKSWVSLEI